MVRIILDTNVLVNADRGEGNYGKRILDLVRWGEVTALISDPVKKEKQLILEKLVPDPLLKRAVKEYFLKAKKVEPVEVQLELADPEDLKLVELAAAAQADFLITEDQHLLVLGAIGNTKIVTPKEFWQWWETQQDTAGQSWRHWITSVWGK